MSENKENKSPVLLILLLLLVVAAVGGGAWYFLSDNKKDNSLVPSVSETPAVTPSEAPTSTPEPNEPTPITPTPSASENTESNILERQKPSENAQDSKETTAKKVAQNTPKKSYVNRNYRPKKQASKDIFKEDKTESNDTNSQDSKIQETNDKVAQNTQDSIESNKDTTRDESQKVAQNEENSQETSQDTKSEFNEATDIEEIDRARNVKNSQDSKEESNENANNEENSQDNIESNSEELADNTQEDSQEDSNESLDSNENKDSKQSIKDKNHKDSYADSNDKSATSDKSEQNSQNTESSDVSSNDLSDTKQNTDNAQDSTQPQQIDTFCRIAPECNHPVISQTLISESLENHANTRAQEELEYNGREAMLKFLQVWETSKKDILPKITSHVGNVRDFGLSSDGLTRSCNADYYTEVLQDFGGDWIDKKGDKSPIYNVDYNVTCENSEAKVYINQDSSVQVEADYDTFDSTSQTINYNEPPKCNDPKVNESIIAYTFDSHALERAAEQEREFGKEAGERFMQLWEQTQDIVMPRLTSRISDIHDLGLNASKTQRFCSANYYTEVLEDFENGWSDKRGDKSPVYIIYYTIRYNDKQVPLVDINSQNRVE